MTSPSEKTVKRLFALSRNRCAYPGCETAIVDRKTGVVVGDVCHIKAQNPGGPRHDSSQKSEERHAFENLILLCKVHHHVIDDTPGRHSIELLQEMKEMHERDGDVELSPEAALMASKLFKATAIIAGENSQVMVASPGGIQAQNVHQIIIKAPKGRKPSALPISGAIGHNLNKRNYLLHLIERYNDFQKWDTSKQGHGKYTILYRNIKSEFGAKWDLVPESKFEDVIAYAQRRILNTKLGRIKNSRGEKCFSSWEEWQEEH